MSGKIKHAGIVESVTGECVRVRILQTSACAACKVAGHCNASESKEKIIDVLTAPARQLAVGDSVVVTASQQVAARALLLGFGLPLVILLGVLFAAMGFMSNDALAALAALVALVPYYLILFIMRARLREQLSFAIEE